MQATRKERGPSGPRINGQFALAFRPGD
jgi:hypothetical protein